MLIFDDVKNAMHLSDRKLIEAFRHVFRKVQANEQEMANILEMLQQRVLNTSINNMSTMSFTTQ